MSTTRAGWRHFPRTLCLVLALGSAGRSEAFDIPLAGGQLDPLIEFVPPPPGSPDEVRFTRDGMLVRQGADIAGRSADTCGFKSLLSASGDFEIALEITCLRLEAPRAGWGQGLVFSVLLDDAPQTMLKLSRLAAPDQGQLCQVEISARHGGEPIYRPHSIDLRHGRLVIARQGEEAVFLIDDGQAQEVLERFPCPAQDTCGVEGWCTRQQRDNTTAEFLIHRLHFRADRFFAYPVPTKSWFSWWKFAIGAQIMLVLGLLVVLARRRGK